MTRTQMLYIVALLTAVAIALIPLTMIIASKKSAHSEPVLLIVPYKVPDPERGLRLAHWKATVQGMSGLSVVL